MSIAGGALQSKQLSSLARARPAGEPTETPTRSTRDAAETFQRARSIGLVPHTLSTAHTHFGFTSDRLEAHCKILRRRPKIAKLGKKVRFRGRAPGAPWAVLGPTKAQTTHDTPPWGYWGGLGP